MGQSRWLVGGVVVVLSLYALMLGGCNGEEEVGPEDVVMSFLQELRMGEREMALDRLWPETRGELEQVYWDLEEELGENSPLERDRVMPITSLESLRLIEGSEVEGEDYLDPQNGDAVEVILKMRDGRQFPVTVRWGSEESRWYVDLPLDDRTSLQEGIDGVNAGQDEESERE